MHEGHGERDEGEPGNHEHRDAHTTYDGRMASTNAKAHTAERAATHSVHPVEPFAGDLSITLNRQQWMNIVGALSIAAGQAALERDYEQMFNFNGVCGFLGQRLGLVQQISGVSDLPPPQPQQQTRTAAAGT